MSYLLFFSRAKGADEKHLSTFAPCRIEYRGVVFASVEHAFQAAKFLYSTKPELFASSAWADMEPSAAKSAGSKSGMRRLGTRLIRVEDWDRDSVAIMTDLVRLRMDADQRFRRLVETARRDGTALLHFERPGRFRESKWGGSFAKDLPRLPENFVGRNLLGKILMGLDLS